MNIRQAPTIFDVAQRAGVSAPTVSRVLTGAAKVSPAKRAAVDAAIAELGFRPSAAARRLATRHSDVIAVVAGNTSRYGYAETLRGIEEAARAGGLTVMIFVIDSAEPEAVERVLAAVLAQPVAGVAVLTFDQPGAAMIPHIPADVPLVALSGSPEDGISQALIDEATVAEELITRLLALGHRTVHHVQVPRVRHEDGRTTGWRRALERADAPVPDIIEASWEASSGIDIGRSLKDRPDVTAVFCGNDEIALGVMRGLLDVGLEVPRDISVAGFDGHPHAALWNPTLTTVHQDFAGLGRQALELLRRRIEGEPAVHTTDTPTLVLRDSTGPAPRR